MKKILLGLAAMGLAAAFAPASAASLTPPVATHAVETAVVPATYYSDRGYRRYGRYDGRRGYRRYGRHGYGYRRRGYRNDGFSLRLGFGDRGRYDGYGYRGRY